MTKKRSKTHSTIIQILHNGVFGVTGVKISHEWGDVLGRSQEPVGYVPCKDKP